ncbi:hypothetical protein Pint_35513 [Pistacia integerrima]|uniref:Uncharacterized protein n=1 Tax=Pistacia integerrima TaxID=434235 RepID=A0ACC0Y458_9ROSI|nr:hypothetical protein Pint_35513 [Pistacia integerrima]
MGKGGEDYGSRETINSRSDEDRDIFPAWAKDVEECEKHYQVNRRTGINSGDVGRRRRICGLNELEKHEGPSIWSLILDQFNDTLVRILLAAAVISFVLAWYDGEEGGEMEITAFVEPLVIFLILIINAIVGVWQENNAEKALEALKEIQSEHATVIRDGNKIHKLPAKELLPGDIVELKVGDKVPADMRVVELVSSTLRVEQGSLTGESEAVNKNTKVVPPDADIQGKKCILFAGTTVVNGNCVCLVTQIGMETEIGKVHKQIYAASQSEEDTPLKKKLNEFGEVLTMIIGVIAAVCNDAGIAQSDHKFVSHGMPTEAALKVLVEKMGLPAGFSDASAITGDDILRCCRKWNEYEKRIATLEFDRDRKSMGVIVNSRSGKKSLLVKVFLLSLLPQI